MRHDVENLASSMASNQGRIGNVKAEVDKNKNKIQSTDSRIKGAYTSIKNLHVHLSKLIQTTTHGEIYYESQHKAMLNEQLIDSIKSSWATEDMKIKINKFLIQSLSLSKRRYGHCKMVLNEQLGYSGCRFTSCSPGHQHGRTF